MDQTGFGKDGGEVQGYAEGVRGEGRDGEGWGVLVLSRGVDEVWAFERGLFLWIVLLGCRRNEDEVCFTITLEWYSIAAEAMITSIKVPGLDRNGNVTSEIES